MLTTLKKSPRAIFTLAVITAISAVTLMAKSDPASASLSWRKHACWCKTYKGRLHGSAAARAATIVGPAAAILPRWALTRRAIYIARRGDPDVGFAHFAVCQFHNKNGLRVLLQNRQAVTRWLVNGGQC